MSIIITNVSKHGHLGGTHQYEVRINLGPVIARFEHVREEGLAVCLRRAAEAVERADSEVGGSGHLWKQSG